LAAKRQGQQQIPCGNDNQKSKGNRGRLLGAGEVEEAAGVDPGVAGHAADSVEFDGVDAEVVFEVGPDVEADDFTEDDDARAGCLAGEDDLEKFAFELGRRLGDA